MRLALAGIMLVLSMSVFAACEVDGISDSPQSRQCLMDKIGPLNLKCLKDKYILNIKGQNYPIDVAFHMDVEEGDSLLVFKSNQWSLTLDGKKAFLEGRTFKTTGKCK